jgi:hypothetical protein
MDESTNISKNEISKGLHLNRVGCDSNPFVAFSIADHGEKVI